MAADKYGMEVTPERWEQVDSAIRSFRRRYPAHWAAFRRDLLANQTEYQLATAGDLRKSGFRNTLSFPIVARPRTAEEIELDPAASRVEFVESLKETLDALIPGFTAPDKHAGKADLNRQTVPNALYREFIRRYKDLFVPGEKV